eukprot:TRINITY_DN9592_c0_g1_i1.p2 TRINITY_DN9592_c0_g1~~TRINITY_DN9592_c0_g1_i1.p2  ORF type:complete len:142 (+),score=21.40 TRINITY_DN9592_c0_g1_i1:545-970(+)
MKYCDTLMDKFDFLDIIDSDNYVAYYRSKQLLGVSPRDLVFGMGKKNWNEKGYIIVGQGIENYYKDPKILQQTNTVRAISNFYCYIIEPDTAKNCDHTKVIMIIHMDLQGWFPVWIQNYFNIEQAKFLELLEDYIQKNKVV